MTYHGRERRRYERYDMEAEVHCHIDYDLVTRIDFWILGGGRRKTEANKLAGLCRNVSAEGMRFGSSQKLKRKEKLFMRLYLPKSRKAIELTGQVRWSKTVVPYVEDMCAFDTGVLLLRLNGRLIRPTIHIDEKYGVPWSIVLDHVFGKFRKSLHKQMVKSKDYSPEALLKGIKP